VNNSNVCLRLNARGNRPDNPLHEALVDIGKDATRASEIIARIRTLGKQSTGGWTTLQLASVLGEVLAMLRPELAKRQFGVEAEMPPDFPSVIGDRVQLQQVFLNLIMNAVEAMSAWPGTKHRRISITGYRHQLAERPAVMIAIRDSGPGIKPEIAPHLFEPFFTTKPDGTGMGLRVSRSIVESHGGEIWVMPATDEGATFCFALPVADKAAS